MKIIWKRTGSHGGSKRWGPVHDALLFYTKSDKYTWNRVFQEYDESYLVNYYKFNDDKRLLSACCFDRSGKTYWRFGQAVAQCRSY